MSMAERITVTLPKIVSDELSQYSNELNEKKSHIIANALERYFDYLDLRIAKARSEELKSGDDSTISFEEIKKELQI